MLSPSLLTPDSYPIPRVDEMLDHVRGSSWFSSLDLHSGYWQVPSTDRGHWQFKVLCFGLCNAPATFERLMDSVLAGIPRHEFVVYLDDIGAWHLIWGGLWCTQRSVRENLGGKKL